MKNNKGFTLIELVVVIVILGILAATALPKFIDLRSDAALAAAQGVAGGLASATSINYSARLLSSGRVLTPPSSSGTGATVCVAGLFAALQAGAPNNYAISPVSGGQNCPTGSTTSCYVYDTTQSNGGVNSATATVACY